MKIDNIAFGWILGICMMACTSNDGDLKTGGDTGKLDLSVSVDSRVNSIVSSRVVTANDFPIEIKGENGTLSFDSYDDMLENGAPKPITLSVGKYTIKAHTPGEIQKQMDEPYYYGEEEFTITKGVTTNKNVTCKMKNTKIQLSFDSEFISTFKDWTVTITDGNDNILVYTQENGTTLQPKYLLIADNVSKIRVSIKATTISGVKVSETRDITKPQDASSNYWQGNDALNIQMAPGEDTDDPFGITGIDIKVDATFVEKDEEVVEVPITPTDTEDPDDSDEGTEDGPGEPTPPLTSPNLSLSGKYVNTPLHYTGGDFPSVSVDISAQKGFKSILVKLKTDNQIFGQVAGSTMGLTEEGAELIGHKKLGDVLPSLPKAGETSYTFSLDGELSNALLGFGNAVHEFIVVVTDSENEKIEGSLKIEIDIAN